MKVGLISDTHGVIDAAIWSLFDDVDLILHAGDWGDYGLHRDLSTIAPVRGIRGNVDRPVRSWPETMKTDVSGVQTYITHLFSTSDTILSRAVHQFSKDTPPTRLILFGHTHRPFLAQREGVFIVNPGSASRPRGGPQSAGILSIEDAAIVSITIHDISDETLPVIARG
jgi:uncharacterized protein